MKICLVHEEYPDETNFGGIATYEKAVAEEYVRQGHKVYVICRGLTKDKQYIENGVNITRIFVEKTDNQIDDYIQYRTRVAEILEKLQNENEIEIIEVPDWGAETVLFEEKRKVPLVLRLHTPLKVWLKYNKNDFGPVKDLMLKWESKMISSANFVTCCSSALKKIIVEDFDISKDNIYVTPNPANITTFYRDELISKEDSLLFVGSLEERKGVLVLAKALNLVFEKYPNLKIRFIGKDTNRNEKNISTKQFVYEIINPNYHSNVEFLGQIPNSELNPYLNISKVGIYPSLFDNFPYAVLEAMVTGLHVVGSRNSGMVEMLEDESSIYETGDFENLAKKIIEKYELSKVEEVSTRNIQRVKTLYSPERVCGDMLEMYKQVMKEYNLQKIESSDFENILKCIGCNEKVLSFEREKGGVANLVFKVVTQDNTYIIKKYIYDYDMTISKELYNKYISQGIDVIKPRNEETIPYNGYLYNIFDYKEKDTENKMIEIKYFNELISAERETERQANILCKCDKYYEGLKNANGMDYSHSEDVKYIIALYETLATNPILKETYLNHGDISKGNLISSKGNLYLIDFDEANITTLLYDFAVVVIKHFVENDKIDMEKYNELKELIKEKYIQYGDEHFDFIVEFYLCKILLEKFYLHHVGKINLYSDRQLEDNYKKYINLLKNIK